MPDFRLFEHFIEWDDSRNLKPEYVNGVAYPEKEYIIRLHDYLIKRFQSEGEKSVQPGLSYDAPLDFTGEKYHREPMENKWDDIIITGAHIFNKFLEEGHPFVDGNKRTGFVTLWIFFVINKFRFKLEYLDYQVHRDKIKKWAGISSTDNISEISEWILDMETLLQKIKRNSRGYYIKYMKKINLNFRQFPK